MERIGIIGGSGLDDPNILTNPRNLEEETPYGRPSGLIRAGVIKGVEVALLGRHGREHTIPPSEVNYRANIDALKAAGCRAIVATTAVGSLREEIGRGDFVVPDQFIDFTRRRINTFHDRFEPGNPVHTPMAHPFDDGLRTILIRTSESLEYAVHPSGTVITIEGPRFSTRAESLMFRSWGADVINMTIATECALANEANIRYAVIAMSTDYDCWKENEDPVSWEEILSVFQANAERVINLLVTAIPQIARQL